MNAFRKKLMGGLMAAGLCSGHAAAADLSAVKQRMGEFPSARIIANKPLWDQPGIADALRAAMGEYFAKFAQRTANAPEYPVTGDGNGLFVAWSCNNSDDCGGNQMTVYFNTPTGIAQVCFRSSEGTGGKVQDLWLASGKARPLPINGCGVGQRDPFAPLKRYGGT